MAKPLRRRSLVNLLICLFVFILNKCILFIYFIKLYWNLLQTVHLFGCYFKKGGNFRIRMLTPIPLKKESKQMTAKVIFWINVRVQSYSVLYSAFNVQCQQPYWRFFKDWPVVQ